MSVYYMLTYAVGINLVRAEIGLASAPPRSWHMAASDCVWLIPGTEDQ